MSEWPWRSLAYLLSSAVLGLVPVAVVAGTVLDLPVAGSVALGACVVLATAVSWLLVARFELWRLRVIDLDLPRRSRRGPATPREFGFVLASLLALWWMDIGVVAVALGIPGALLTAPFQPTVDPAVGVAVSLAGLLLLPVAAYPITAWAGARGVTARTIFAPPDEELGQVVRSRARLVDAFETERRRIERDLHDGAQQRLVALSMKLGVAKLDLPPDSPVAADIAEAHDMAKQVLVELRELIRGVHPRVLTDRGLGAAVRDAAGRSPVPVQVDVTVDGRPPAAVEVAAFYVVSEALANVAKHSRAARCSVRGRMAGDRLVVEVLDDGVGGADIEAGTGLLGLADRLAVLGGTLSVSSPAGGPTLLRVEIPCVLTGLSG
jgi:signal transduction histidine kinase